MARVGLGHLRVLISSLWPWFDKEGFANKANLPGNRHQGSVLSSATGFLSQRGKTTPSPCAWMGRERESLISSSLCSSQPLRLNGCFSVHEYPEFGHSP